MFTSFANWIKSLFSTKMSLKDIDVDDSECESAAAVTCKHLTLDINKTRTDALGYKGVRIIISNEPLGLMRTHEEYWSGVDGLYGCSIYFNRGTCRYVSGTAIESSCLCNDRGVAFIYVDSCLKGEGIGPGTHRFELPPGEALVLVINVRTTMQIDEMVSQGLLSMDEVLVNRPTTTINLRY